MKSLTCLLAFLVLVSCFPKPKNIPPVKDILQTSHHPDLKEDDPVAHGKKLFIHRACAACHSVDGSKKNGPSMKWVWGRERTSSKGEKAMGDEAYFRESILYPNKFLVKGYPPNQMPSYLGQFTEEEIKALIAYAKSIK